MAQALIIKNYSAKQMLIYSF